MTLPPTQASSSSIVPMQGLTRALKAIPCALRAWVLLALLAPTPALSLEQFVISLPSLEMSIIIDLGDVESAEALVRGNSDLSDLARAGGYDLGERIVALFRSPLPEELQGIDPGVGDPLLEQVLSGLSQLIEVEDGAIDTTGQALAQAIRRARQGGQGTLLGLLRELPGASATVDLGKVLRFSRRLARNQAKGRQLAEALPSQAVDPTLSRTTRAAVRAGTFQLAVNHRPAPMRVAWVRPDGRATGAPIVISHGLWDSPESFLGWAHHLARHGHPVLLPEHQGSDRQHKSAMVAGRVPPPGASELALRPMDITALLNALPTLTEARLGLLDPQQVGVVGHSWGAITTLQLGGLRPESNDLIQKRCDDQWDPERNLSWSLQCSLMAGGSSPSLADGRVRALVAVSPPARLLFDVASSQSLRAPTLLVSGTSDWVVPSGPEAITPFRVAAAASKGHRLVLAQGGDHFNLRAPLPEDPGVLGDVILSWMQTRLLPGDPPLPPAGGDMPFAARPWGNAAIPLVDVSEQLSSSP